MNNRTFIYFNVIGNIGSGKSTILKVIRKFFQSRVKVLPEPIEKWSGNGDKDKPNILQEYYANQDRYAALFQIYSTITKRLNLLEELSLNTSSNNSGVADSVVIFQERGIMSDEYIFCKNLKDNMTEVDTEIIQGFFNFANVIDNSFIFTNKNCESIVTIYLKTDPEICIERICKRDRKEEIDVTDLSYVSNLHKYHEQLVNYLSKHSTSVENGVLGGGNSHNILTINGNYDFENDEVIQEEIVKKICDTVPGMIDYLEGYRKNITPENSSTYMKKLKGN